MFPNLSHDTPFDNEQARLLTSTGMCVHEPRLIFLLMIMDYRRKRPFSTLESWWTTNIRKIN